MKAFKPALKRTLVDDVQAVWQASQRRACEVLQFDPKSYRYKSRRTEHAANEQQIKVTCLMRVRYGYRRVQVMLRLERWKINHKKTQRIYKE